VKTDTRFDVFLWLNEQSKRGKLPASAEPLVTDFFYAIR
jgi:hypothetical protein